MHEAPGLASSDDLERQVAALWSAVLNLDEIARGDVFTDLGGDSVSAVQIVVALWDQFGAPVPLEAFFANMTVARLVAEHLRPQPVASGA